MMSIRPGVLLLIITIIISGIVQIPAIQAQKTDVIIMNNGDRITGEVKKLEYGLVTGVIPYDENRHFLLRLAGNLKQITKVHFGFRSDVHFLVSAKKSMKQAPPALLLYNLPFRMSSFTYSYF